MRFKKKSHRAVHKCCKTCCYKNGIKCSINWYGYDNDGQGGCYNKTHILWWINDDPDWYRKSRNNWKRMHRKEAQEMLFKKLREEIEWREFTAIKV